MKKHLLYLLTGIVSAQFACETKKNEPAFEKAVTPENFIQLPKKAFAPFVPVPEETANEFMNAFREKYKETTDGDSSHKVFPYNVFVDRKYLESIVSDSAITGIRIFPIIYTKDTIVTYPDNKKYQFKKGMSGFLLAPTKGGARTTVTTQYDDYNDPCRPPCQ